MLLVNKKDATGFGPFKEHKTNASWCAVKELTNLGIEGTNLVVYEIPVEYGTVMSIVPTLWKNHKPKLMVHCGLSSIANTLVLEQKAHNDGYCSKDVRGCLPPHNCCLGFGPYCLQSSLDMHRISHEVNMLGLDVPIVVSENAGRYLCEFIYYTSLHISTATAFIHVPPLDQPYSLAQLSEAIRAVVIAMMKQLDINISGQKHTI